MNKRLLTIPTVLLVSAGIAACGSSSGSKAAGIQLAPSGGQTVEAATAATTPTTASTPTTPTTTTPTVSTPTSGPLSTEPKITVPKGAPPKKLVIKNLVTGTGAVAGKDSDVTVNYVGALYSNGKVFDASWNRHQTFPATLGPEPDVIPGWVEGIPGMKVGGRRELIIPPSLAYGATGSGAIPKNATLIFVIDLLGVSS
jgi:peptidylprolyl isomerase